MGVGSICRWGFSNTPQSSDRRTMENQERIPIKFGRSKTIYYAVFSKRESSLPNAVATYHVYTANGTYFMHMYQRDIDRYKVRP